MRKISFILFAAVALLFQYSCGDAPKEDGASADGAATTKTASGKDIYMRNCASCHLANGEGIPNTYPPLAKSDYLGDKDRAITQIIKGSSGEIEVNGKKYHGVMPPQQLNDDELAAVLSYVYSSFGNSGGAVTADEVKGVRAKQ